MKNFTFILLLSLSLLLPVTVLSQNGPTTVSQKMIDLETKRLEQYKYGNNEFLAKEAEKALDSLKSDPELYFYKKSQQPVKVQCINCR